MRKLWIALPCLLALVNVCNASDPVRLTGTGSTFILAALDDFGGSDGPATDQQLEHAHESDAHSSHYRSRSSRLQLAWHYRRGSLHGHSAGPDKEIYVVSRLDSSGTTYIWTDYLSKVSPDWSKRLGRGTQVLFPVGNGTMFNGGVVGSIKHHAYSIGYLQTTYAIDNQTAFGLVENASGVFTGATVNSITAAAAAVPNMPPDFRVSITNAPGVECYPVSSFTWLLVPSKIDDSAKKRALLDFVRWVLTKGQRMAPPLNYAPLPADVATKAVQAANEIQ